MRRLRTVIPVLPTESGAEHGLAYTVWMPTGHTPAWGGVVVLHGAGSCKENHHDFAEAAIALGLAAIVFDQRGHGQSERPMDGRALEDVAAMARLLRHRIGSTGAPLALRGSSMGGYLAILAAAAVDARAVVAVCPAGTEGLRRGLADRTLEFDADREALDTLLDTQDLGRAVAELQVPLLLLHAEGDERVPIEHSRELASAMRAPGSRLIEVPGGHHRSIQHDGELQAVSLRFIVCGLDAGH